MWPQADLRSHASCEASPALLVPNSSPQSPSLSAISTTLSRDRGQMTTGTTALIYPAKRQQEAWARSWATERAREDIDIGPDDYSLVELLRDL